ncbi:putative copper resistance protein D [Nocardioides daedukensis]|uniref:Putative copper resistance protein D n=1 Tax=Nocardioides daedukensis TaxID=634462 RepID=A0A7Y9UPA6_9ACTN|nr:putative copper resistance protein D [Nocardioides daedukensis]
MSDPDLPRFTFARVFTEWGLDPFLFIGTVWVTGLYLIGVVVLHRRGDRWPIGRTLAFVGAGMGGFVFATSSGISAYDTTLLSVHMVQHMILSMWVPLFLALGAPVTLALRTLPGSTKAGPRRWLLAVLHSRVVKVLSFPLLAFALYVLSPWALYFTGWYDASLDSVFVHEMMHIHLVLVGSLFFWPLMGIDPIPGRVGYPFRLLLVFLTLPFHAFLGVTIMSQDNLIGEKHYLLLREGPMGDWLPSIAAEQNLAGGILWASGELVGVVFFATLFVQWVRSSIKEAKQVDRRLDRQESRAAATRRPADG